MKCPADQTLGAYLEGKLSTDDRTAIMGHIDECPDCRGRLAQRARVALPAFQGAVANQDLLTTLSFENQALGRGSSIGRFLILDPIGKGSMGIVHLAYDPVLDRKVALKFLRPDVIAPYKDDTAKKRLLREAQAMAKLSHPNVVTVHEVLEKDNQIILAMEYVEGRTLRSWLQEEERTWQEIREVFVAAGQGLHAAHKSGMIHRDFKPENVLIAQDGRVLVTDFGLARITGASVEMKGPSKSQTEPGTTSPVPLTSLTVTGSLLGTPAYMAPEQFEGRPVDARSDQFGFCVALYEAMYHQRPFSGTNLQELMENTFAGEILETANTNVPDWLAAIIKRGLAVKPEDRHPSMKELLEELKSDPEQEETERRALRNRRLVLISVILLAVVGPVSVWYGLRYRTVQLCKSAEGEFSGIWNKPTKNSIKEAFLATQKPYAQGTWERVERAFDAYLEDWTILRGEVCQAKHIHGTESEELFDLKMSCLKTCKHELRALTKVFAKADSGVVEKAVQATSSLTGINMCADEKALRATYPPPKTEEVKTKVEAIREKLVEVGALKKTGKYTLGLEFAKKLKEEANTLDYKPIQAEALYWIGELLERVGEYKEAETMLYDAFRLAGQSRAPLLAAKAMSSLVWVIGCKQARYPEGILLSKAAESMLEVAGGDDTTRALLLGFLGVVFEKKGDYDKALENYRSSLAVRKKALGPDHHLVASILSNLGNVFERQGKYDKALENHRRSLAIVEKTLGSNHPNVAVTLNNLGIVFYSQGKYDKALENYRRALAIWEKALGPDHPDVSKALNNLGNVFRKQGSSDKALENYRRVLAIREKVLGPDHPDVARTLNNLGIVFTDQGKYKKALKKYDKALAIWEKAQGPEHPNVAMTLNNLGSFFGQQGKYNKASENYRRALTIWEKALGPEHPYVAMTLKNLGLVFDIQGKHKKAVHHYRRTLAIYEKVLEPEHPNVAEVLISIGDVFAAQGKPKHAIKPLERAVTICNKKACDPTFHGEGLFALARVLLATGGDKTRAIRFAKQAKDVFGKAPKRFKKETEGVNAWLKKHDRIPIVK